MVSYLSKKAQQIHDRGFRLFGHGLDWAFERPEPSEPKIIPRRLSRISFRLAHDSLAIGDLGSTIFKSQLEHYCVTEMGREP